MNEIYRLHSISPGACRYIKLGAGGRWRERCIAEGVLQFQDLHVPHAVAAAGDWDEARRIHAARGLPSAVVTQEVRELKDFYALGEDCLWITFGGGRLWWAFCAAEVEAVGDGIVQRRVLGAWRSEDIHGRPLEITGLSSVLTRTASYQRTICKVAAEDYLLRILNAEADRHLAEVATLRAQLAGKVEDVIRELHWADFEELVDLIFTASGWRRQSRVGGNEQADTDLVLQQSATGETAFVQVKAKASTQVLADYLARYRAAPDTSRFFFVCHTLTGRAPDGLGADIRVWQAPEIADQALRAGLVDWLLAKRL